MSCSLQYAQTSKSNPARQDASKCKFYIACPNYHRNSKRCSNGGVACKHWQEQTNKEVEAGL